MTTAIIGVVLLIALLVAAKGAISAYNAPKVAQEKSAQEIEDTKQKEVQKEQQKQRQDTHVVILDKRMSFRERMAKWRAERRSR